VAAERARICYGFLARPVCTTGAESLATGFYLANAGQDTRAIQLYLGHKNIQHTVRYTELAAGRFKDFWKD
jgi:integrase